MYISGKKDYTIGLKGKLQMKELLHPSLLQITYLTALEKTEKSVAVSGWSQTAAV